MNLKSIIITSFAFISIVSCKPDTKDYEKKKCGVIIKDNKMQ